MTVQATDDVGIVQLGYRAATGSLQDASTRAISPPSRDRVESFDFIVPADLAPGSVVTIQASAVDTKGQVTNAPPIQAVVLDAVPPTVTITGTSTGDRIRPGQTTTVAVSAQDQGGITAVAFTASGAAAASETRTVAPPYSSVATTFSVTVPLSAGPGDLLRLDATATDAAGNVGASSRVVLSVADAMAPTVGIRTENGRLTMAVGRTVTVIASAGDETGVARIDLAGDGAFQVVDSRPISPPSTAAEAAFTISVPAGVPAGATLVLQARAVDISGNSSVPANLTLTAVSLPDVVLPPTLVVLAGDAADLTVQLPVPAPAGGVTVGLQSANPGMAFVPASVVFAAGEQSKTAVVTAVCRRRRPGLRPHPRGAARHHHGHRHRRSGTRRRLRSATQPGGRGPGDRVAGRWSETLTAETDASGRYVVSGIVVPPNIPLVSFRSARATRTPY